MSCKLARATISQMLENELDDRRKEMGVEDALKDVAGVSTEMLVKFGESDIKTVEDLAGCATDDLVGWSERKDGEAVRQPGVLDGFDLSREEAEAPDHAGARESRLDQVRRTSLRRSRPRGPWSSRRRRPEL